jgi:hypothetical protein
VRLLLRTFEAFLATLGLVTFLAIKDTSFYFPQKYYSTGSIFSPRIKYWGELKRGEAPLKTNSPFPGGRGIKGDGV